MMDELLVCAILLACASLCAGVTCYVDGSSGDSVKYLTDVKTSVGSANYTTCYSYSVKMVNPKTNDTTWKIDVDGLTESDGRTIDLCEKYITTLVNTAKTTVQVVSAGQIDVGWAFKCCNTTLCNNKIFSGARRLSSSSGLALLVGLVAALLPLTLLS